ncbi:uncharacterized protein K444DRAFT_619261 [Hyaloscypha bicolor E]|uniref:Uncharacterized protein n=1 Tax=Hyaloscypha bicolor E TaxID=1095630 RepID=A0A2J6SR82_9HELO|nr:uncharacterized protein K444DRAFT_619261 [Hyaloscypha bicolor E]PMD53285.1 hypothetical protein K444DRAFT_619261 [Hyaloscypha bicolor E]
MLSTDSTIALAVGLGGLLVSTIGTIVGYMSYKSMKAGPRHFSAGGYIGGVSRVPSMPPKAHLSWPRDSFTELGYQEGYRDRRV